MSLMSTGSTSAQLSFPRVSGDEPPNSHMCYFEWSFSPRERG